MSRYEQSNLIHHADCRSTLQICIGPVCIPLHLLLPFVLGVLHSYGCFTWIKKEWVDYRWWWAKIKRSVWRRRRVVVIGGVDNVTRLQNPQHSTKQHKHAKRLKGTAMLSTNRSRFSLDIGTCRKRLLLSAVTTSTLLSAVTTSTRK
jgi:hypothetical protein